MKEERKIQVSLEDIIRNREALRQESFELIKNIATLIESIKSLIDDASNECLAMLDLCVIAGAKTRFSDNSDVVFTVGDKKSIENICNEINNVV